LGHSFPVFRYDQLDKILVAGRRVLRISEYSTKLLRTIHPLGRDIPSPVAHMSDSLCIREALLTLAQPLSRIHLLGDILRCLTEGNQRAAFVCERFDNRADKSNIAIRMDHSEFRLNRRGARSGSLPSLQDDLPIFGVDKAQEGGKLGLNVIRHS